MIRTAILGTGISLPETVVTTESMLEMIRSDQRFGIPHDFIAKELGIRSVRRCSRKGVTPSELASEAAENLFSRHGINRGEIDAVLYCGMTREYYEPSTAHIVQSHLGMNAGLCFDISNACLGFVSGIQTANALIVSGQCRYVLVVTSELFGEHIEAFSEEIDRLDDGENITDLLGAFTAGDAGAAMLLGPSTNGNGIQFINTKTQARHYKLCYFRYNQMRVNFKMEMNRISARTLKLCQDMLPETLGRLQWDLSDIDLCITHQVGRKPFEKTLSIAGVSRDQSIETYPEFGNMATATIPVCWHMMNEAGRLGSGQKLMMLSSGSGISVTQIGIIT